MALLYYLLTFKDNSEKSMSMAVGGSQSNHQEPTQLQE